MTQETLENIISALEELGKKSYFNGPEGVYNEYSLVNELINHLLGKPTINKDEWYNHYEFWLKYVRENNSFNNEWYYDIFLDRMKVIDDFAEIILKD